MKLKQIENKYDKTKCCMCSKDTQNEVLLIPLACLNLHGQKSHRICQECWWNKETGFARENGSHCCPGCEKGLPLTKVNSITNVTREVIDLTGE